MVTVDTNGKVRRAYFVEKRSIKSIARALRLARNTVRSIVRAETERRYERRDQPMPQLGPYVGSLDAMLAANVVRPKRERLTYQRIFEDLRLEDYRAVTITSSGMSMLGPNNLVGHGRHPID